jgi:hypothetical protein
MTKAAAVVALVLSLAAGCGGGGRPHFEGASGWHLLSRDGELAASNVPFAEQDRSFLSVPSHTVGSLPRRGVVMWLLAIRRRPAYDKKFPAIPLRVAQTVATNPPEGFSCPPAGQARCFDAGGAIRRLQARDSRWDIGLTIFFGTDHPSSAQVAAANAELARFRP